MPNVGEACTVCNIPSNENYTLHTFELLVCVPDTGVDGPGSWVSVGNVVSGSFGPVQELLDHFRGVSGALDARVRLRRHWQITAQIDEITARNLSLLANADMINAGAGCRIPLEGAGTIQNYGVYLEHVFPNGTTIMGIRMWVAQLVGDWTLEFSDAWTQAPLEITSLECPTDAQYPYGYIELNYACPAS